MTKRNLLFLVSTLLAACGADGTASGCSLTIAIEGRPSVTKACIAGATSAITGPAAAQDNQVALIQTDSTGDFFVLGLHLFLLSPPTTGVYDEKSVRSYSGILEDKAGRTWGLNPKFSAGSFEVVVKSMEELGPEDDQKGGAFMGYRIHGTAKATFPAPAIAPTSGATLTATF